MKAYFIKGCTDPMLGHFMTVTESIYHLGYAERPQELAYAGCQWSWDSNPAARECGAPANINDYGGTTSYVVHKNATGVGYTWMSYSNMWHGFYKTFRGQLFQFPPYEPTVMYPEEFDMEFNPPDHNTLSWFKLQRVAKFDATPECQAIFDAIYENKLPQQYGLQVKESMRVTSGARHSIVPIPKDPDVLGGGCNSQNHGVTWCFLDGTPGKTGCVTVGGDDAPEEIKPDTADYTNAGHGPEPRAG